MSNFEIATTRYNNETWNLNKAYREKKNIECVYASSSRLASKIDPNAAVFVIEMNNEQNQIMGIGLIRNKVCDKTHRIQEDSNYNLYTYIGNYHMSRELLDEYNPLLVYILDEILFKGYTHSKRGMGITRVPDKVLKLPVCEDVDVKKDIKNVFIHHFRETANK